LSRSLSLHPSDYPRTEKMEKSEKGGGKGEKKRRKSVALVNPSNQSPIVIRPIRKAKTALRPPKGRRERERKISPRGGKGEREGSIALALPTFFTCHFPRHQQRLTASTDKGGEEKKTVRKGEGEEGKEEGRDVERKTFRLVLFLFFFHRWPAPGRWHAREANGERRRGKAYCRGARRKG